MKKLNTTFYTIQTGRAWRNQPGGLRCFCLSDLHGNIYGTDNQPVLRQAAEWKPDLIFASGDMLSGENRESDKTAADLLAALTGIAPVYFVNGNHEIQVRELDYRRYSRFVQMLSDGGVHVMNNRSAHVESVGERIGIYGFELPWEYYQRFCRRRPSVLSIQKSIGVPDKEEYSILLTHNPVYFREYMQWGADFVFAGHLHGGFMRLPVVGGVISPQIQLFPKYDKGVFQEGNGRMVVGAGMGNHSWLFRIHNPAEMVAVRIR